MNGLCNHDKPVAGRCCFIDCHNYAGRLSGSDVQQADNLYLRYQAGMVSRREAANKLRLLLDITRGEVNDLLDEVSVRS